MRHLAQFIHDAFKNGGRTFAFGSVGGWFGGWLLVFGDATLNAWGVATKIVVVLVSAAATGFATVGGKDVWIHFVRPRIFKNKIKEDDRDDKSNVA